MRASEHCHAAAVGYCSWTARGREHNPWTHTVSRLPGTCCERATAHSSRHFQGHILEAWAGSGGDLSGCEHEFFIYTQKSKRAGLGYGLGKGEHYLRERRAAAHRRRSPRCRACAEVRVAAAAVVVAAAA